MSNSELDVIAAGHICLDMLPRFTNDAGPKIADLMRPGTLLEMGDMTFGTGGSVSNTGIALKIFGCRVGYVAKVGDDIIGSIITDILKRHGSAEGISVSEGEPSSYTVVVAPQGIDRIFLHCPGTNDTFVSADIDFDLLGTARLFHLGYPTLMDSLYADGGRELGLIYDEARKRGVTTSMDISLPDPNSAAGRADWRAIYERVLPSVDIYTPSIEEAMFTLDPARYLERKDKAGGDELIEHITVDEFREIAGTYIDMGCAVVALKAGHNGWYFRTAGQDRLGAMGRLSPADLDAWVDLELWCPAFAVEEIASAAGAGDTAIAGFLTAMLRGHGPAECLRMANCAGYMNLRGIDSLSGLVSWDEMEAAIPSLTVRDLPALHGAEWEWDGAAGVWRKETT